MMQIQCIALVLLATASSVTAGGMRGAVLSLHITADAPAPSKRNENKTAPSEESSVDTTAVDLEIKNMNYMDMTDEWKDPFDGKEGGNPNDWMMGMDDDAPKKKKPHGKGPPGNGPPGKSAPNDDFIKAANEMRNVIDGGVEDLVDDEAPPKTKGNGKNKMPPQPKKV